MLTSKVAADNLKMTFKEPSQRASFAMYADALSTETKNTIRAFALAGYPNGRLAIPNDTLPYWIFAMDCRHRRII